MLCCAITAKGGTETSEGFIPHLRHSQGFDMPVRPIALTSARVHELNEPLRPARDHLGRLIYTLPGGGTYVDLSSGIR